MSRFRSPWLALFGGVTLIALSLSTAFAGKPDGTNTGPQVSAFVRDSVGDVQQTTDNTADDTATVNDTQTQTDQSAPSDHGTCVAAVAQGEDVGGDNENHGGAVSEAARVTCAQDATTDAPKTDAPSEDANGSEVDSGTAHNAASEAETPDAGGSDSCHQGDSQGDSHGDGDSND